jgi:hypothetical protein
MDVLDVRQFEAIRRSMLRSFGRMSSRDAKGFIIDLDRALEGAGLGGLTVKWRGGDDGLFTATGQFDGDPAAWPARMLAALEDLGYEDSAATVDVSSGAVHISFATWAPEIGLATVRIDAQPSAGDIRAR